MRRYRLSFLTLPLALGSLALAACGGSNDPKAGPPTDQQVRAAGLQFAKCMRKHGVNMPDPQTTRGGGMQLGGPDMGRVNKTTMNRAEDACRKILERVRGPAPSKEEQQKFKERALKFARCMREQGIDFPDPTFESGGMKQRVGGGTGPNDPRFRDAAQKCQKYDPKRARFQSAK
jgi:hypothetical protein